ncbi:hypothetical protein [Lentzea cavernae]|uniref:Secreted protein n=1 Tax=Lentzea cavernae TaxID=2020703 RepID=A0ABQ3MBT3_9PSEU|nr:hypothetical protein [Lentzea cavernae]GHH38837.1 hypothetical protein GCM10017774_29420 [Lentzea cavernae]
MPNNSIRDPIDHEETDMFRKATAATLVLAAVPAVLTMTILTGTAQADHDRRGDGHGCHASRTHTAADGDTPWGSATCDDDTPWGRSRPTSGRPAGGDSGCGDTPWG